MALSLTEAERKERASNAAKARWAKAAEDKSDWETIPLDKAHERLAVMRTELNQAVEVIERRSAQERINYVECCNPTCTHGEGAKRSIINVSAGRYAGSRSIMNPETGTAQSYFACSAACYMYMQSAYKHPAAGRVYMANDPNRPVEVDAQQVKIAAEQAARDQIPQSKE